jgi:hypothetical protein
MYVLKAFATHSRFVSNVQGIVSPFGELSNLSLTYAKEKGFYKSTVSNQLDLITFTSKQDLTNMQLTQNIVDHVLTVTKAVYDYSIAAAGPIFTDQLLNTLITDFQGLGSNFTCGEVVTNGEFNVPEWIEWKNTNISSINPNNKLKVWLANDSFEAQYDDFEIVVVPPITTLNNFFLSGAQVQTLLTSETIPDLIDRVQIAKQEQPETVFRVEPYDYVDPFNNLHRVVSNWGVLIYGAAGNNADTIGDAIIAYILANSTHERAEWVELLPDLFKRTEFILIPHWNSYAIPNRVLEAGIYSPVVNLKKALALIKQIVSTYPGLHIDEHGFVMGHPYKSLAISTVGSPDNRDNKFEILDVFEDYLNVPSTSFDFGRMHLKTQNWLVMIANMLPIAETMTAYTSVPVGMTKVTRNGILYLVKRFDNINYLIAAKLTLPELNEAPPMA